MQTTAIVSVGRKLSTGGELADRHWGQFTDRVLAIVLLGADRFDDIHFTGFGQGRYEGQLEDSFTVVATIDAALVDELKARLSITAHIYGQDSIAVTTGTTDIVAAVKGRR